MESKLDNYIKDEIKGCQTVMTKMLLSDNLLKQLEECSRACIQSLNSGGKILLAGNGGSAADAQHIAAELSGRFYADRLQFL